MLVYFIQALVYINTPEVLLDGDHLPSHGWLERFMLLVYVADSGLDTSTQTYNLYFIQSFLQLSLTVNLSNRWLTASFMGPTVSNWQWSSLNRQCPLPPKPSSLPGSQHSILPGISGGGGCFWTLVLVFTVISKVYQRSQTCSVSGAHCNTHEHNTHSN